MEAVLRQYGWVGRAAFVLVVAYFLAKITNVYVGSLFQLPRPAAGGGRAAASDLVPTLPALEEFAAIAERNIFNAAMSLAPTPCTADDPRPECKPAAATESVETPVATPTGDATKSSLPYKLWATLVMGDGKDSRSTAVVSGNQKGKTEADVFAVRDPRKAFAPGVTLVQVKPKRIEFLHQGRLEYLELDEGDTPFGPPVADASETPGDAPPADAGDVAPQVTQASENKFVVNQAELDSALSKLDVLYTEIRAVPNFKDGKVDGMKILSIKPGSIFSKLGLRRGDVLSKINGQGIDIKNGFQLFTQLREQKQFQLELDRQGTTQAFEYDVR